MTWVDIISQLLGAAILIAGCFLFAIIWAGNGENEMRKIAVLLGGLALAGCGAGVVTTVTSIFDQIQQAARTACGYTFAFATIDALIKALGGPPIVETISGILCTQARALVVQEVPKAAGADPATGRTTVVLGTVVINGKPVTITVLR
jgi:hypothetical protein